MSRKPITIAVALIALLLLGCPAEQIEPETQPTDVPDTPNAVPPSTPETPSTTAADLGLDILIAVDDDSGSNNGSVRILSPDGSERSLPIQTPFPSQMTLVPDDRGGFVWQPLEDDASTPDVFHVDATGNTTSLISEAEDDEIHTLVGADRDRSAVLVTHRQGTTPDAMTVDLLSMPLDGSEPVVVAPEVGRWESVLTEAAAGQSVLYARSVTGSEEAVIEPPDSDAVAVFEGGKSTGEYIQGVDIATEPSTGIVLVETAAGYPDYPTARLLLVELPDAVVRDEVEVPLQLGVDDTWLVPRDVSVADEHVLVNRYTEDTWLTPLVYDMESEEWMTLDGLRGRAALAQASGAVTD